MLLRIAFSLFAIISTATITASAQTIDDATRAFADGDYTEALPTLRAAADKEPRNTSLHHMAGVALMRTGNLADARRYLEKGNNDSKLALAELAFLEYRFDEADDLLDKYEAAQKKARKPASPQAETIRHRVESGRSMLDRVEQIVIVDSLIVDREDFFRAYRLSAPSGSIRSSEVLPSGAEAASPTTVYVTESGDRMIWAAPDADENFTLVQSTRLADGSWESPASLGSALNDGGDANFPFLMPDGVTLYFANDGENSLGGYDIFISRFNGQNFLQPQNIGMPYNSPFDDYLLAIDELTGAGWWATDRNQLGDRITIYRFIPRELRINYPVDTPDLASRARVSSISSTWEPGEDYTALIERINSADQAIPVSAPLFRFPLPDGRVITDVSQFRSSAARSLMAQLLDNRLRLSRTEKQLESARVAVGKGDVTSVPTVRSLESELLSLRDEISRLTNEVVKAESR
ncbi:MAG: tetratricopeptide repeat protein [Bacteroides sp.]|nr:tetratricopeptide repeat protein [Bacteroides sp.]